MAFDPEAAAAQVLEALLTRRYAEFRYDGGTYLIQPDNNKGCDYVSIWRTSPKAACLGQALYDIFDGVDLSAVRELLALPCLGGRSFLARLEAGEILWSVEG